MEKYVRGWAINEEFLFFVAATRHAFIGESLAVGCHAKHGSSRSAFLGKTRLKVGRVGLYFNGPLCRRRRKPLHDLLRDTDMTDRACAPVWPFQATTRCAGPNAISTGPGQWPGMRGVRGAGRRSAIQDPEQAPLSASNRAAAVWKGSRANAVLPFSRDFPEER